MEIKLDKPLIVLDIEATGDKINKDRIVEIAMIDKRLTRQTTAPQT